MRYPSSTNATQLEYAVDANLHTAIQSVHIRPTVRTCVHLIRSIRLCRIRLGELRLCQDVTIHHGLGRCSSFNLVPVHERRWAPDEGAATLIKINRMQITRTSTRDRFCEKFWGLLRRKGRHDTEGKIERPIEIIVVIEKIILLDARNHFFVDE